MTSQRLPPSIFLWGSLILEFLCLYRQHNGNHKQPKTTKDEGKNSRRSNLRGLSFFHKHKAQMTTDREPRSCRSSRMSVFSPRCCWLFPFSGLLPRPVKLMGQPVPQHLGSTSEETRTLLHDLIAILPAVGLGFMRLTSAFTCIKIQQAPSVKAFSCQAF